MPWYAIVMDAAAQQISLQKDTSFQKEMQVDVLLEGHFVPKGNIPPEGFLLLEGEHRAARDDRTYGSAAGTYAMIVPATIAGRRCMQWSPGQPLRTFSVQCACNTITIYYNYSVIACPSRRMDSSGRRSEGHLLPEGDILLERCLLLEKEMPFYKKDISFQKETSF